MSSSGRNAVALPRLSVIIPTYNERASLQSTLDFLDDALKAADWTDVDVVVVDDGSSDGTAEWLESLESSLPLRVIRQSNAGRFAARRRGLEEAKGDVVLFLDSRVEIHPGALGFVSPVIADSADDRRIWNADCVTASTAAPWTRFWDAITFLAWRRYLADRRTTSYGEEEFDHFPKGTGMFLAPRDWLIEASDDLAQQRASDPRRVSDDTLLIRNLLRHGRINISPEFGCTYHPRATLGGFLRNAIYRGSTFVDGHLRPGHRFHRPFQLLLVVGSVVGLWSIRRPRRVVGLAIGGSVGLGVAARAAGAPTADAASLGLLAVPFGAAYGIGIANGFRLRRPPTASASDR